MIEPYGAVVQSRLREFREFDLKVVRDTDYELVLAHSKYSLIIQTERYYQPSLLACLNAGCGQKFELGLAARVLAGEKFRDYVMEIDEIKERYHLERGNGDEHARATGIFIFAKAATRQIFSFVAEFGHEMIDENGAFRSEYFSRERELLDGLGL